MFVVLPRLSLSESILQQSLARVSPVSRQWGGRPAVTL